MEVEQSKVDENAEVVGTLVENHRRFLAFVQRRVGNRTDAEDVLQAAILRGIAKRDSVRDMESTVAWFYRVLRNALTDHYRKRGTEARLFESGATVVEPADDSSLTGEICTCFRRLLPALKPEYSNRCAPIHRDRRRDRVGLVVWAGISGLLRTAFARD
jgi:RNA polymerase sigma factor (sigma-70 family)